jgi:hypothetical protein
LLACSDEKMKFTATALAVATALAAPLLASGEFFEIRWAKNTKKRLTQS